MTKTKAEARDKKKFFWVADIENIVTVRPYKV